MTTLFIKPASSDKHLLEESQKILRLDKKRIHSSLDGPNKTSKEVGHAYCGVSKTETSSVYDKALTSWSKAQSHPVLYVIVYSGLWWCAGTSPVRYRSRCLASISSPTSLYGRPSPRSGLGTADACHSKSGESRHPLSRTKKDKKNS